MLVSFTRLELQSVILARPLFSWIVNKYGVVSGCLWKVGVVSGCSFCETSVCQVVSSSKWQWKYWCRDTHWPGISCSISSVVSRN